MTGGRDSGAPDGVGARDRLRLLADAQLSRAVQVAATLGLADHMADGPQPVGPLAQLTSCDPDALHRLLRYLASAGVFEVTSEGRFGLTAMGRLLRSTEPDSLRVELSIDNDSRAVWWSTGELLHSIRTGRPAYDHVYGRSMWETMLAGGGSSARFQQGMAGTSDGIVDSLLDRYDWSGITTVCDLGGGNGSVLARLLDANPGLRGMLVDLPAVTAGAKDLLASAELAERCQIIGGNLFESIPTGADLYLLVRVLHDWPDQEATTILRNCRDACADSGRILVVDLENDPGRPRNESLASDIMMLLLVGGKERSPRELAHMLGDAGFAVHRRIALHGPYVVTEARPV